jgi:hypothetical protein
MRRVIAVFMLVFVVLAGQVLAGQWTTPVPVASGINTQYADETPFLSSDGLSLYFSRGYDSGYYFNIYEAKRSQSSGDFTSVSKVFSTPYCHVMHPWVSADNLRMYYHEESSSAWQAKMSQRASVNDPWSAGTSVAGIPIGVCFSTLSADELTLVYDNSNVGNWDMFIATRPNRNSAFGNIRSLSELNTSSVEGSPSLSPDGLTLYFNSDRNGISQIFETTRQSLSDPFGNLQHLTAFDSSYPVAWPDISISSDGKSLYFGRNQANGVPDIYVSYNVPEPATIALFGLGLLALRKKH